MSKKKCKANPNNNTFDLWIKELFDYPVPQTKGEITRRRQKAPLKRQNPLDNLTELFTNAGQLLKPYSNDQIYYGFSVMVWELEYLGWLVQSNIDWESRQCCIQSIYHLFNTLFAKRCDLPYTKNSEDNQLNTICFMWWDDFPTWGNPQYGHAKKLDEAILTVMSKQLTIQHLACQESALHGLGHWHLHYPQEVEAIVDDYLNKNPYMNTNLREYAIRAQSGCVQ